jgi:hypothetical protein
MLDPALRRATNDVEVKDPVLWITMHVSFCLPIGFFYSVNF